MSQPRFGFSIAPGEPLGVGREVAEAEALGYDRVGVWDSPALFRDPWVTLASVARDTSRIRLGTWVTNPLTRHPVVTASAAAALDDLAPGRAYIGIGSGDTGVSHLGGVPAPLARLREYVVALRRLLEEGTAEYEGQRVRLGWACRRIPLLVAAHGPRSLRLAGAIGDGVIVGLGITPEVIRGSLDLIERGAREAGRSLDDLDVWFTCHWSVDGAAGASRRVAAVVASFASHVARTGVEGKFVPDEYREGLLALGAAYDKVTHGAVPERQLQDYAELAERLGVAAYLRQRFALAGAPGEIAAAIREAMRAGATNFDGAIDAPLAEHRRRIAAWAGAVLSQFDPRDTPGAAPLPSG
jgi:5,10-methylenetetrahydromethanopterin reductase